MHIWQVFFFNVKDYDILVFWFAPWVAVWEKNSLVYTVNELLLILSSSQLRQTIQGGIFIYQFAQKSLKVTLVTNFINKHPMH